MLVGGGRTVTTHATDDPAVALGGTTGPASWMSRAARSAASSRRTRAGVTFPQPDTTRVEAAVTIGADTTIGPGVSLAGQHAGWGRL